MRKALLTLLPLAALVATVTGYDFLLSCANMVEMLWLPFTPEGRTSGGAMVIGGPFLVLFIAVSGLRFIGAPLLAAALTGSLGGWSLRRSGQTLSPRAVWLCAALAAACTTLWLLGAIQSNLVPISGPANKPKTPAFVLACLAGVTAGVSTLAGASILRRVSRRTDINPSSPDSPAWQPSPEIPPPQPRSATPQASGPSTSIPSTQTSSVKPAAPVNDRTSPRTRSSSASNGN